MFLLAITRQSIARRIEAPVVNEFRTGEWVATVATDGWLSSSDWPDGGVAVREAGPLGENKSVLLAEARFSKGPPATLEFHKTLVGGRFFYYNFGPDGEAYCASYVRLLRMAGVPIEQDPRRLPEFFTYRYVTAPGTLFKGIHQLVAGQRLRFEWDGQTWRMVAEESYAPPQALPQTAAATDGSAGYVAGVDSAIRGSLRALCPARDQVHVLLSGGLDSSVLYGTARDELGVSESYSAAYPFEAEADDVERRYALSAAEALGARHTLFVPPLSRFLRGMLDAAAVMEEPVVHLQSVLLLLLFRDVLPPGQGTVVVGEGADGMFGLPLHRQVTRVERFRSSHPRLSLAFHPTPWGGIRRLLSLSPVEQAARRGLRLLRRSPDLLNVLGKRWGPGAGLSDPRHVLWQMGAVGNRSWVRERFGGIDDACAFAVRMEVMGRFAARRIHDQISLHAFLGDASMVQRQWSRLGESASKFLYYPFTTREVFEAAYSTPWEVKLREPKAVLRDVARRMGLSEEIVSRRKADFMATPARWSPRGAALEPLVPLAAKVWEERDLRHFQTSRWPDAHMFLMLVNYALWTRLCIRGESLDVLKEELDRSVAESRVGA